MRVFGTYSDGTARKYGDFLHTYDNRFVNLIETNDDGDLIAAPFDEWGDYGWQDVITYREYNLDYVGRWDDPHVFVGANI